MATLPERIKQAQNPELPQEQVDRLAHGAIQQLQNRSLDNVSVDREDPRVLSQLARAGHRPKDQLCERLGDLLLDTTRSILWRTYFQADVAPLLDWLPQNQAWRLLEVHTGWIQIACGLARREQISGQHRRQLLKRYDPRVAKILAKRADVLDYPRNAARMMKGGGEEVRVQLLSKLPAQQRMRLVKTTMEQYPHRGWRMTRAAITEHGLSGRLARPFLSSSHPEIRQNALRLIGR